MTGNTWTPSIYGHAPDRLASKGHTHAEENGAIPTIHRVTTGIGFEVTLSRYVYIYVLSKNIVCVPADLLESRHLSFESSCLATLYMQQS